MSTPPRRGRSSPGRGAGSTTSCSPMTGFGRYRHECGEPVRRCRWQGLATTTMRTSTCPWGRRGQGDLLGARFPGASSTSSSRASNVSATVTVPPQPARLACAYVPEGRGDDPPRGVDTPPVARLSGRDPRLSAARDETAWQVPPPRRWWSEATDGPGAARRV